MQAARDDHYQVNKLLFGVAKDIFDHATPFDAGNHMLDDDTYFGDEGIAVFILFRQFVTSRLFLGLLGRDPDRFIALKAGVFVQRTALRKGQLFVIADLFVVFLAFVSPTEVVHASALEGDNNIVFYRMGLLFAAVVPSLLLIIGRPLHLALRPIDPKLGFPTLGEVCLKVRGVAGGALLPRGQCALEHLTQGVNPIAGLPLRYAKFKGQHLLKGIHFAVIQDEQQLISDGA